MKEKSRSDGQKMGRIALLVLMDIIVLFLSYFFAWWIVYSLHIPFDAIVRYGWYMAVAIFIKIAIFALLRMYQTLWRYASVEELWLVIVSVCMANFVAIIFFIVMGLRLPTSVLVMDIIFDVLFVGGIRITYRTLRTVRNTSQKGGGNALIVGAGEAGIKMLRELQNSSGYRPFGFIDDDPYKQHRLISGIRVMGGRDDIPDIVASNPVAEIIIAMPTALKADRVAIARICEKTGVPVKMLPTIEDILNYDISQLKLRDLQIEDLLDREEVVLDKDAINKTIAGRRVLVTGGAGSIGSELCRQIVRFHPKELFILDINENDLYYLELELNKYIKTTLKPQGVDISLTAKIASIREADVLKDLFAVYKPEIVFHAAAHKHVPLMERTPAEAVRNNVFGTKNVLDACVSAGVRRFVQISTDKAVNPTNVMGATKRICEILVQAYNRAYDTEFVAVRFGNVLGSNGSVIPIFKKQIEGGGPVTVTHKDITRFFMTIPEATQLVLQAASMARGGEIFVLDMGKPEKITDLAEKMISLAGYEPYTEIPIEFVGLRPGEKLYEELSYNLDDFDHTTFDSIFIEKPMRLELVAVEANLKPLRDATEMDDSRGILQGIKDIVPEFQHDV